MRVARVTAVAVGLLAIALPFGDAAADTVQDKQRQAASLSERIESLQERAEQLTEDYNQAVLDLEAAGEATNGAKARLTQQEAGLATLRGQVSQFALRSYVYADQGASLTSLLDPVVLSGNGGGRVGYTAVALGANLDITDQLRSTLEDTDRQRAALEVEEQRQRQLSEIVASKRQAVDAAGAEAKSALQDVQGDLVKLVAAEEERKIAEAAARQQAEIKRQQEAAAAAARPAASASPARPAGAGAAGAASPAPVRSPSPGPAPAPKPAPAPVRPVPPPAPGAAGAVQAAMSQVGNRYVAYAASPSAGFDCSGLTMWAWGQAGVGLPHQSRAQFAAFPKVPLDQLQPGDLVFSGNPIHHVGLYIGGGQMVHASSPRVGVVVGPIRNLVGASRPGG